MKFSERVKVVRARRIVSYIYILHLSSIHYTIYYPPSTHIHHIHNARTEEKRKGNDWLQRLVGQAVRKGYRRPRQKPS
jgi:hypothetical protein